MIKRTQIIEILNNIKATRMSFFAIMLFVAMSIAIFCGISWTCPAIQNSANEVFNEGKLHDFEIIYPYGLNEDDFEYLRQLEGIDEVEGGYSNFQIVDYNGKHTMKVVSVTEEIDTPVNVKGTVPRKKGEIAVCSTWAESEGVKVGDKLKFKHDAGKKDKDGMKYLLEDTYTVTAIMDSPAYYSTRKWTYGVADIGRGVIDCIGWVAEENFDESKYTGYPQTYIRSDLLREEKPFSKAYDTLAASIYDKLEADGKIISVERFNEVKKSAQKEIDKNRKKLNESKAKIDSAEKKIAEAERKLAKGQKDLAEGKKTLDAAHTKLTYYQSQLDEVKVIFNEMEQSQQNIDEAIVDLESADLTNDNLEKHKETYVTWIADLKKIGETLNKLDLKTLNQDLGIATGANYNDMDMTELNDRLENLGLKEGEITKEEILAAMKELQSINSEVIAVAGPMIDLASKELEKGWTQYKKGLEKYNAGKKKLEKGQAELAEKKQQFNSAVVAYEKNVKKLNKKQKQVDNMEMYGWTIMSRDGNGGIQAIQRYNNVMGNLRYSMALLFVIIGLLVSYSSMSRIIKDQIISLGTKKALGLRRREITLSYLIYAGLAVLAGSVIGFLAGTFGIERLIAVRIGSRFITGIYPSEFLLGQALLLYAVETGLILLTAWVACNGVLKMQAVELLKGPKPPEAKERFFEKWKLWDKLSLLNKTIVNNCFNDKKRVIGTIIGVAGCTALVVTSITMNGNLEKSFTKHYEDVYHYNTIVKYRANNENVRDNVANRLDELGITGTPAYTSSYIFNLPDGKKSFVKVTIPFDDEHFGDMYTAVPEKELTNQTYENGVWLNDALEDHFDAKVGDSISIVDSSGQTRVFTIEGFFEYHLISYQMIMQESVYEKVMGEKCKSNTYLVDSGDIDVASLREELKSVGGVMSVKDDYSASESAFQELSQVAEIVILIYLLLSVMMAIVVLLDLNVVCIEEKKRELIVLMINGFSLKDARRYVYRDVIVLTCIGIIFGLIFGTLMGNFAIMTIEPKEGSFISGIDWMACLMGVISSSVLSFAMTKIAVRRISKFSLTDINKM